MIKIGNKHYTFDQARNLLSRIGWQDDVNAYVATLQDGQYFSDLLRFKDRFREFRKEQREKESEQKPEGIRLIKSSYYSHWSGLGNKPEFID